MKMRNLINAVETSRYLLEYYSNYDESPEEQERAKAARDLEIKRQQSASDKTKRFVRLIRTLLKRPPFVGHVGLTATIHEDDAVFLSNFGAYPRGQGWGANFLRLICNAASREGVVLVLDAANNKLKTYYSQFGFEPYKSDDYRMRRLP